MGYQNRFKSVNLVWGVGPSIVVAETIGRAR